MLDVPDSSSKGMTRVVCCDGETVEGRGQRRRYRLMGLRVFERVDQSKVFGDLIGGRRLQKYVRIRAIL